MSHLLEQIQALVAQNEAVFSEHAYDRIVENDITTEEIERGVHGAIVVEDYPEFHKGPSLLALQLDRAGKPVHVVWGLRKGTQSPAVVITAYRPDPELWDDRFRRRK